MENEPVSNWLKQLTNQRIALDSAALLLSENSKQIEHLHNNESKEQFETVGRLKEATDFCSAVEHLMVEIMTAEEKLKER